MKDILTLTLPKNLTDLGIFQINIHFQSEFNVYVHQKGNLFTDMPDSRQLLSMDKIGYEVIGTIGHEVIELLQFDGVDCGNDKTYLLDECRLEHIQKVKSNSQWFF